MNRYKQAIHIEGKCVEDILKLPCVYAVQKQDNQYCYLLTSGECAYTGDWLCLDYNNTWKVLSELNNNEK